MFSGIIEAQARVLKVIKKSSSSQLILSRPSSFDDLELGHSLAMDGVCLTIEELSEKTVTVTAGPETLRVTQWEPTNLVGGLC